MLEREGENKKKTHGQTGLKWQQSALMETDGRMRRYEWRRWRRGCIREARRLLKSWQDRWREGLRESESGLDRNDEHRACLSYKMEGRKEKSRERECGKERFMERGN